VEWKQDADAKGLWKTQQGGAFMASPAGGTITGFGAGSTELGSYGRKFAGAIIIDDPLKPDDASSEVERASVNERLINTVMSRRNSRETPIILIMQRLHEDDMTGFVLAGNTGETWHHLKMPALDGDKPLWAHKHTMEDLLAIKSASPYTFSGQYQQEPAPEEGIYFLRDWFKPYGTLPANLNYYGASDFAVSDKRGDYTVHGVFGIDPTGEIYLVDWWRKQATADVWIEQMLDMADSYKTLAWAMEGGVIEKAVMPLIRSRMMARNQYPRLAVYPSTTDKEARARNIQGRMAARGVHVPTQPWVADLLSECINFPNGKHDDQVDVLSLLGNMLANLKPGVIPPKVRDTINTELPTIEQLFKRQQRELDTI
jgi:predicted phage terminase large subunit-like protein